MKKLYTFVFSLLLTGMANAQNAFSVTVDGREVAHKSTCTVAYAEDGKYKIPDLPQLGKDYGLYPEVKLTSTVSQDVVVTLRDESHDEGTQFCYGTTCDELYKTYYQSTKTANLSAGVPVDLQIHVMHSAAASAPYEVKLLLDAYGTQNGEAFSCTLLLKYDPEAAGFSLVTADESRQPYYTLSGVRVAEPKKGGVYVRGGRKVVVK